MRLFRLDGHHYAGEVRPASAAKYGMVVRLLGADGSVSELVAYPLHQRPYVRHLVQISPVVGDGT